MNFKTSILGLAMAAVLVPMSALADHNDIRPLSGSIDVRIGAPSEPPRGTPSSHGRYERRIVSRWIPGYQERVWVDGYCQEKHGRKHHKHHFKRVCTEGHYESHWVPGQSVEEEQWVWVAYPPPPPARSGVQIRLSSIF